MTASPNTLPGTGLNDASVGTQAWSNPSNITNDGTSSANINDPVAGDPYNQQTNYLIGKNFGFSIPTGTEVEIIGVKVVINKRSNFPNQRRDIIVRLQDSTGMVGDDKAIDTPLVNWPASLTDVSYGGATDDWNASLTPAKINNSEFGVRLSAQFQKTGAVGGISAEVDYFKITVYYQYEKTFSETLVMSETMIKKPEKIFKETLIMGEKFVRGFGIVFKETLIMGEKFGKIVEKIFKETLIMGELFMKVPPQLFKETLIMGEKFTVYLNGIKKGFWRRIKKVVTTWARSPKP